MDPSHITVALQAHNGQFVCAERGGGAEVVANRDQIGPWETFGMGGWPKQHYNLPGVFSLWTASGMYVCAEGGGGHEVVANRPASGAWESFLVYVDRIEPKPYDTWDTLPPLVDGALVAFRMVRSKYKFICAEGGGGREVVCDRDQQGPWETFTLRILAETWPP